ncbi:hypothetical protein VPG91_11520 [Nitrospirillum amazonense]|uniref:hypothetical protein n=1 Tax=Nitrospirillum amazonense TaxID=28077 RepID=UPI002DD439C6|nr:hypothetical protein [Nitrospirillum amazonense]MEC4591618.1 hypothetical protein [Nitrospirillum amazonense]
MMRFHHPEAGADITSLSIGGVEYQPDDAGVFTLPAGAYPELASHGLKLHLVQAVQSTTNLSALTTEQLAGLTPDEVQSLSTDQLAALSTTEVQALTTDQVAAMVDLRTGRGRGRGKA